ncbi:hypothetical protein WA538_002719 [Blastocystis sp. DL]
MLERRVLIRHENDDGFLEGIIDSDEAFSLLQKETTYPVPGYSGFFYQVSSNEDTSNPIPDPVFVDNRNPVISAEKVTATTEHPVLQDNYHIMDHVTVNEAALCDNHTIPHILLPLTKRNDRNQLTTVLQFSLPLRMIPESIMKVIVDKRILPIHSTLTVFVRCCSPSSWVPQGSPFAVHFPIQLREGCDGSLFFSPVENCSQTGGVQNCVFRTHQNVPYFSYMGFLINEYSIRSFLDIILIDSTLPQFSSLTSLLRHFDAIPATRPLVMDLLAILQAAGPSPRESLRLTEHLVTQVPMMRVMGVSPFLRYTETTVLHVTTEEDIWREFRDDEMAGIVEKLRSRGLAGKEDLEEDWRVFQEFGGRVVFGGDLSVSSHEEGRSEEFQQIGTSSATSSMASSHPLLHLQASDTILSVCQEGLNRSQVLAQAVFAARRALFPPSFPAMTLCHGAVSGFDPTDLGLVEGNLDSYIRSEFDASDPRNTSFEKVFRSSKLHRIGGDVARDLAVNCGSGANDAIVENRQYLYNYFSTVLWSCEPNSSRFSERTESGRILLFLFSQAFPVVLHRLVESSCLEGDCFKNMVIIAIPMIDPISHSPREKMESVTMCLLEGMLRSLVGAQITECAYFGHRKMEGNEPDFEMGGKLLGELQWVKMEGKWFIGRVMEGTNKWREQKWEYLQHVIHRLEFNQWPSSVRFSHRLSNVSGSPFGSRSKCDIYCFGPVAKESISLVRWEGHADAIIRSLATQIGYLNDLGIVYNNAFIDSVELGIGGDG